MGLGDLRGARVLARGGDAIPMIQFSWGPGVDHHAPEWPSLAWRYAGGGWWRMQYGNLAARISQSRRRMLWGRIGEIWQETHHFDPVDLGHLMRDGEDAIGHSNRTTMIVG